MQEIKKKDNAKRQAEYRKRHIKEGSDQRLNVILGLDAKLALERMAKHYGVTNKNVLERLLLEAQSQLIEQMDGQQQAQTIR
jgi:hypothetical protein